VEILVHPNLVSHSLLLWKVAVSPLYFVFENKISLTLLRRQSRVYLHSDDWWFFPGVSWIREKWQIYIS
jgi:hypothetical protein